MSNSKGAKAPLNPFYKAMPFIFKTTGEVRRLPHAERFSKKLSIKATVVSGKCFGASSLTVSDHQTTYILSKEQTKLLMSDDANVMAMVINGYSVEPTSLANMAYLPLTQLEIQELA